MRQPSKSVVLTPGKLSGHWGCDLLRSDEGDQKKRGCGTWGRKSSWRPLKDSAVSREQSLLVDSSVCVAC